MEEKPVLELVGRDGNAFAILGHAKTVALRAGWSQEKITSFFEEARKGDYDHLLQTCMKFFDVV